MHRLTGDYPAAAASRTQALALYRDIGERGGEAEALNSLGELLRQTSDSHRARDHHAEALAIAREIGDPLRGSTRPGRHRPVPPPGRQARRRHRIPAAGTHDYQRIGVPGAHASGNPPRPRHLTKQPRPEAPHASAKADSQAHPQHRETATR